VELYSYTGEKANHIKTPPQYVKTAVQNADGRWEYTFTDNLDEAARFDRLACIIQPIVEAKRKPSFYFDQV